MPTPFGTTQTDNQNTPLGSVYVPNTANADLTPLEGGTASTDTLGRTSAPVSVSSKDGNMATLGAKADTTASSDSGTFTLMSLFKRLLAKFPSIGPQTKSNSLSVTFATDNPSAPVLPGYDPTTHLFLPCMVGPKQLDGSQGYAVLQQDITDRPARQLGILTLSATVASPLAQLRASALAARNAQAYCAYQTMTTATTSGLSLFSPGTKTIEITRLLVVSGTAGSSIVIRHQSTDYALGTATSGPTNKTIANATATTCTLSGVGTGATIAGSTTTFSLVAANTPIELITDPFVISQGVTRALAAFLTSGGATTGVIFMEWIEY